MFRCSKCIFYNAKGYQDMGATIPECKLKLVDELRKKNNKEEYDLFNSLITDELDAQNCNYFTYVSEAVDIIKERYNKANEK